jgi:hypothetical protein
VVIVTHDKTTRHHFEWKEFVEILYRVHDLYNLSCPLCIVHVQQSHAWYEDDKGVLFSTIFFKLVRERPHCRLKKSFMCFGNTIIFIKL